MTATFAEFLGPARSLTAAAVAMGADLPPEAKRAAIWHLDRMIRTMARYLGDMPLVDEPAQPAPVIHPPMRAALDARVALRRAAQGLRHGTLTMASADGSVDHAAARHLAAAATCLAAGRDLLQTHFTTDPHGLRSGCSYWAPAINSGAVTHALLAEVGGLAQRLAPWAAGLALTGSTDSGVPPEACLALHAASRRLWTAATKISDTHRDVPVPEEGRRLLAAIPANVAPERVRLTGAEPVAQLCEAVTVTAERLRHTADRFARGARWSPAANSSSWRRHALASAITSHTGESILWTLSDRAAELGTSESVQRQLGAAAEAMKKAWPAWRAVAAHWDMLRTGNGPSEVPSPVAVELDDLVLGAGRLAYRNSQWSPARADASPRREPAELAADHGSIMSVVSAVHHAVDALARITTADRDAVRQAAADHRLYVPTRLLPAEYDIPRPYGRATEPRVDELLSSYDHAIEGAERALDAVGAVAATLGTASRHLTQIRAVGAGANRANAAHLLNGQADEQSPELQRLPKRTPRRAVRA